jgi:hypothetical protein
VAKERTEQQLRDMAEATTQKEITQDEADAVCALPYTAVGRCKWRMLFYVANAACFFT